MTDRREVVLVRLYLVEAGLLASGLLLHRQGDRTLGTFMTAPSGVLGLLASLATAWFLITLVKSIRDMPPPRARGLAVPLVVNLGSLLLAFVVVEAGVRALTTPTSRGPSVAGTILRPQRWDDVTALGRASSTPAVVERAYLVHDRELGWTNGRSRRSGDYHRESVDQDLARLGQRPPRRPDDDETYLSSVEGIRSPRVGMSFAATTPRRRLAAVGDSFTFGLEVRYEDTWSRQLELALGPEVQVLNFGVDGYGVDQAYLRYRRDVAAWNPERVILGVIDDDFRRTMCVYGFLCFPGFGMPFTKPRLVLTEQGLVPLNLPLPTPETVFAQRSITDLPFLEFDIAYEPADWRWRLYHHADSIRFLLSRYPRFSVRRPSVTDEATASLNAAIVRTFVKLVRERGAIPMVVYFPSRSSFSTSSSPVRAALAAHDIRYLDTTECVTTVAPAERFVALHYSPRTNAAMARCLHRAIAAGFES